MNEDYDDEHETTAEDSEEVRRELEMLDRYFVDKYGDKN